MIPAAVGLGRGRGHVLRAPGVGASRKEKEGGPGEVAGVDDDGVLWACLCRVHADRGMAGRRGRVLVWVG